MPDIAQLQQQFPQLLEWTTNGAWALLTIIVGWILAGWAERGVSAGLIRVKVADAMLRGFFASLARWALLAFAGIAALEKVGVQTTSLVALLGAAGLAVGLALQGTLSHLAAGVMLLIFRPFQVGDSIEAGGLSGTIKQVSLFHTHLVTGDNVHVVAPNALLWAGPLRNLTHLPMRKIEVLVPLPYEGGDAQSLLARIQDLAAAQDGVAADPAPVALLAKFGEKSADVSLTAWCATGDTGKVKSRLMAALWGEFKLGAAG